MGMKTILRIMLFVIILGGVYFFTRSNKDFLSENSNEKVVTENAQEDSDMAPLTPSAEGDDSILVNEDQGTISEKNLSKDVSISPENATWTISYSNNGFYPREMFIKKGDTVRFTNNSDLELWVSSEQNASQIDSSQSVMSGEVFMYTFKTTGTWKYFNKMDMASSGTIKVK